MCVFITVEFEENAEGVAFATARRFEVYPLNVYCTLRTTQLLVGNFEASGENKPCYTSF